MVYLKKFCVCVSTCVTHFKPSVVNVTNKWQTNAQKYQRKKIPFLSLLNAQISYAWKKEGLREKERVRQTDRETERQTEEFIFFKPKRVS